jgi:hypothetical protein
MGKPSGIGMRHFFINCMISMNPLFAEWTQLPLNIRRLSEKW